jgi:hypothetical protein
MINKITSPLYSGSSNPKVNHISKTLLEDSLNFRIVNNKNDRAKDLEKDKF